MKSTFTFCFLIFFIFSACTIPQNTENQSIKNASKPNFIYILVDDAGYGDFGCYGQQKFKTPSVDRMAREGMKFTAHYAGSTVCAPSRSSLMTGQHTGHTYVRGNRGVKPEGQVPIPGSEVLLPEIMKQAGYVTGGFGKWGMGFPGSEGAPNNQGVDQWFGYNCQGLAHNFYPEYLWRNEEKVIQKGNADGGVGQYSFDVIHEEAIQFIDQNKDTSFFLYLPYTIPHAELMAPDDELLAKYKGAFEETAYKGVDDGPKYRRGPYGSQEYPRATFAAMMERLDGAVGEILDKLVELGIDDNTLVMFTSDNGPHLEGGADPDFFDSNGPYQGYKRDLYEGGIRVPMLAWWPGTVQAGTISGHISAFWDVLPTVTELASAETDRSIDGISFAPTLLAKESQPQHEYLYWEFHERGGKQAVRKGKWKGIRLQVRKNPNGPIELYDLESDPGETRNLADSHPDIVAKIAAIMNDAHEDSEVFPFPGKN